MMVYASFNYNQMCIANWLSPMLVLKQMLIHTTIDLQELSMEQVRLTKKLAEWNMYYWITRPLMFALRRFSVIYLYHKAQIKL